jgi:hypothetical protein
VRIVWLMALALACSGGDKKDDDTTSDTGSTTDTSASDTSTADTWWTDTGGVCASSSLCACPDGTCGLRASYDDCDRDADGCICASEGENLGDCETTGGSGHSGGSGGTTTTTTTTSPASPTP